jgi:dTDP-glucose 4,6-dehydratase/UDP-glucuronate decarboxylase
MPELKCNNNDTASSVLEEDIRYLTQNVSEELSILAGSRILFTGGAGFLGYLFLHLLSQVGRDDGRECINLTVYENFSRGRKQWLDSLCKLSNFSLVEHDITQPIPESAPNFDYIIHAASIASPTYYRRFPIETIDANVNGLRYILNYALHRKEGENPVRKILFFSTSEIYGDPSPEFIPTPESYRGYVSCTGPRACYDESKRLGETLCVNFASQYNIPVVVARPFNNYGPGLGINDKRILPDLARNIFAEEDIVLFSDGTATRTFCYVADAISGYLKVLIRGKLGCQYNIGTETPEISMWDLASKVAQISSEIFEYEGRVVCRKSGDEAYLTDNPNRRCPDISRAKKELGFNPRVSLEEGLKRSLIWYKGNVA